MCLTLTPSENLEHDLAATVVSSPSFATSWWLLFVGALKQRNYVYPELSCPQNPQPIPWSETGMRALQPTLSTLEITLQKFMATYDIPGMSAGVVYDQTPIWARGFGVTNVSSPSGNIPTPDTIFRIGM